MNIPRSLLRIAPDTMYKTPQPDQQEIRLLTISPGTLKDVVKCSLDIVSLNSDLPYIALSYCWGDEMLRGDISLGGHTISVTKGLQEALQYLRNDEKDVVVWADAICINQTDHVEKSSQIRVMGKIYAQAALVWIWLGESDTTSDIAMDFLNGSDGMDFGNPTFQPQVAHWQALQTLLLRPWWSRMWILQEVLLAQKAILNCGLKFTPIENVVRLKEIELEYRRRPEERLKPMQFGLYSPFGPILSDWNRLKRMIEDGGIPLFEAATMSSKLQCRFTIDKIYALLGICNEADRHLVEVDTSILLPELMTKIAIARLKLRKKWNPLFVLQTHQANKSPGFPTWVPDWTKDDFEHHLSFVPSQECRPYVAAALNSTWHMLGLPQLSPDEDENFRIEEDELLKVLVLSGMVVDRVSKVFPVPHTGFYEGDDIEQDKERKLVRREAMIAECEKWEAHVQALPPENTQYRSADGRYDAFWRTLVADRDYDWKGPIPEERDFAGRFEAWMGRTDQTGTELEMYCRPFNDAAIIHSMYRSFIITEKGYFGLGRQGTRSGDEVCILRGGCVPFILRQRDTKYHELGERHTYME